MMFETIRREVCEISNDQYHDSFENSCREKFSEGASGSIFYFTEDKKFIVKTMTEV